MFGGGDGWDGRRDGRQVGMVLTFLFFVVCLLFLDSNTGSVAGCIAVDCNDKLGVAGQGENTIVV